MLVRVAGVDVAVAVVTARELWTWVWVLPAAGPDVWVLSEWPKNTHMLPITLSRARNGHGWVQGSSMTLQTQVVTLKILPVLLMGWKWPSQALNLTYRQYRPRHNKTKEHNLEKQTNRSIVNLTTCSEKCIHLAPTVVITHVLSLSRTDPSNISRAILVISQVSPVSTPANQTRVSSCPGTSRSRSWVILVYCPVWKICWLNTGS